MYSTWDCPWKLFGSFRWCRMLQPGCWWEWALGTISLHSWTISIGSQSVSKHNSRCWHWPSEPYKAGLTKCICIYNFVVLWKEARPKSRYCSSLLLPPTISGQSRPGNSNFSSRLQVGSILFLIIIVYKAVTLKFVLLLLADYLVGTTSELCRGV